MNATQFKISILLVVCFAAQLFSENHSSSFQTLFVVKIEEAGAVIDAIQTKDGS